MFRKFLIVAMFATAAGYCFAAETLPQVVTSEVFYSEDAVMDGGEYEQHEAVQVDEIKVDAPVATQEETPISQEVPVWPLVGSDADVEIGCEDGLCSKKKLKDNIRIVSKIGADLVVENNFNLGARGEFAGWSGGANMLHGNQLPAGFDDECANGAEMPLLGREMLEDDGGSVLSVSRSGRKNCADKRYADSYAEFAARTGIKTVTKPDGTVVAASEVTGNGSGAAVVTDGGDVSGIEGVGENAGYADGVGTVADVFLDSDGSAVVTETVEEEIAVDITADAEAPAKLTDQVRSWVVANGQTLREVLQNWCNKEGWDLVWTTSREYPIEASAVFKGRFVDVASALVRNFSRATPIPYAKFYKGNRVLVISTDEE